MSNTYNTTAHAESRLWVKDSPLLFDELFAES